MHYKQYLPLALLALCSSGFAGQIGDSVTAPSGIILNAPSSSGIWTVGVEGSNVRASGNDFTYGLLYPINPTGKATYQNETVTNHSQWGYGLDLKYNFANSSRFVQLNLSRYDLDDSDGLYVNNGEIFLAPVLTPPSTAGMFDGSTASASVDNKVTSIDLVGGQHFTIGQPIEINVIGGLRWADLSLKNKALYNSVTGAGSPFVNTYFETKSEFKGLGPRLGINTKVNAGSGVAFIGSVNGSLLIGNLKSDAINNRYAVNGSNNIFQTYHDNDRTHVVPELDARLGIAYSHAVSTSSNLNIEVGYQAVDYFDSSNIDWLDTNTPNTSDNYADFGYYGPYIKAEFSFV